MQINTMLGKTHFYFGIIIILVFLLTGQYMDRNYDHLKDMELMNRALFRAGHLYILLFGLINLSLGINLKMSNSSWLRKIQYVGSIIIFISAVMVVFGFFKELPASQINRPITGYSLYLILSGVLIHALASLLENKKY